MANEYIIRNGFIANDNSIISGSLNITGSLNVNGNTSLDGTLVVNEAGADKDVRIKGNTDDNLFFTDASTDRIGIKGNIPSSSLDNFGSQGHKYRKITANSGSAGETDYTLSVANSGSNWTLNIPDASTCLGRIYVIKRYDNTSTANIRVIPTTGSIQDMSGIFNSFYDFGNSGWATGYCSLPVGITYQSNGTDWEIINTIVNQTFC